MQYFDTPQHKLLVLAKGEDLISTLVKFAREQHLESGWISGIGSCAIVTLGYYHPVEKKYQWQSYQEPLEIVGMQGNLSMVDGEPFWHIHGTFSTKEYKVIGGHVKNLLVGLTAELFISSISHPLTRFYDEDTGLKLLREGH